MARVKISTFGGISPSVDPRNLPAEGAQTAENLDLRYGDFRPLRGAGASVASVAAGTLSIHRTPSGVWLQSTSDADFVDGQINDATVERVYVTGRSAYPEAWQSGSYRRLGVPRPPAAPTATATVVDEYTSEEQAASITQWVTSIRNAVAANATETLLGNGLPSTTALSAVWLAHAAVTPMPTTANTQIVYAVPTTAGVATSASNQFILNPLLNGTAIVYTAADYWAIPITWRAVGYDVDETDLATAIKVLLAPDGVTQLVPDATADEMAARIVAIANPAVGELKWLVDRVNLAQGLVVTQALRTDTDDTRVYPLSAAIQQLESALQAINAYFAAWVARVDEVINAYAYLVPAAVDRLLETRGYVYTHVSDWGEESAPSPVTPLLTIDQNDSVDVTIASPDVVAPYGTITHWRLYRSSTTNVGAEYQFVAETPVATTTYNDTLLQEELQEVCPSMTWTEPRSDLFALAGLPNGIMVGLAEEGRILCFSEPYQPYAWPREYEISLEYPGVGIGVFGQTAVVLTQGQPYYVSGSDSANMSAQKIESAQACVSKRSIASADGGVLYASPDGICLASPSGVEVLTLGAYNKEDWQALGLATSFAAFSEGVYRIVTEN